MWIGDSEGCESCDAPTTVWMRLRPCTLPTHWYTFAPRHLSQSVWLAWRLHYPLPPVRIEWRRVSNRDQLRVSLWRIGECDLAPYRFSISPEPTTEADADIATKKESRPISIACVRSNRNLAHNSLIRIWSQCRRLSGIARSSCLKQLQSGAFDSIFKHSFTGENLDVVS